jgi:DNA anti-recombination protein RmuC
MPLEADAQKTGVEPTPDREVPVMTGTLPAPGTAKKKKPEPGSQLSPDTPAEMYSSLLEEKGNGNARGLPQTQLLNRLQTGYGNQYTEKVIAGLRDKNVETAEKEIKEEKEKEKETTPSKEKPAEEKAAPGEEERGPPGEEVPVSAPSAGPGDAAAAPEPAAKEEKPPAETAGKPPAAEEKKEKKTPEGKGAKKGPGAPGGGAGAGAPGEPGGAAAFLKAAGAKAFKKAVWKVKRLGKHEKTHKSAEEKGEEAKKAVIPPEQESQSRADAKQVETVAEREEPKTDETAAKKTLDHAIKRATPKTIEDVDDFKDDGKAEEIRDSVMENVKGQTHTVQQTYRDIGDAPKAEPAPTDSPPIPEPEEAPPTAPLQMGKDIVPTLPPEQTDLSSFENEAEDQLAKEEIDPKDLAQVDSGPLAEANTLRDQVKKDVQTGPAEINQKEQEENSLMNQELAADEISARARMKNQRKGKLGNVKGTQDKTKKKEEDKRKKVTEDIQNIYQKAKKSVETKLSNLEKDSLKQFDQGQEKAAAKFENTVKKDMKAFKKSRYGGYFGWTKKLKDWALGMDKLERVKEIFTDAKDTFVGEINTLIKTILAGAQKTITDCKTEIQQAKDQIAEYVTKLEPGLKKIAAEAQKEMTAKLDALDKQVNAKEKELKKKLARRREQAIKAIDEKIRKMKEKLKGALHKLGKLLLKGLLKLFKWALEKIGAPADKIINFIKKAASAFWNIIKSPLKFLGNLGRAVGGGFSKFSANFSTHLKVGLMKWLTGAIPGITIPTEFTPKAIFGLAVQIVGLTPAAIKMKVAKYVGQENVERIEKVWEFISTLISGGVGGLWGMMKQHLSTLKEVVFTQIKQWLVLSIIKGAVKWIAKLFLPGGGLVGIAQAIYKVVMFIIERIRQIMEVVEAVVSSLSEIAAGAVGKASAWIEEALGRFVPVGIGLLASLVGIGGISGKVRSIFKKFSDPIHKALDKVIAKVASKIGAVLGKGKKKEDKKAEEKMPEDKKKLWIQGQAAIDRLKNEAKTKPFDEKTISQRLRGIKNKYKFKKLTHRQEGKKWILISEMNPKDKDEVPAAEEAGTEKNPLPLNWPKSPSIKYPTLYFGGQINKRGGNYAAQSVLKANVGKEDATGCKIKEYKPHRAGQGLAGGKTIGLDPVYRTKLGKVVGPLSSGSTPGGKKINNILKKYGFSSKNEYMDGDHVVEIQMGGKDVVENLWPLDASENRGAGSILSKTTVKFPDGQEKSLSKMKKERRKYFFKITGFK